MSSFSKFVRTPEIALQGPIYKIDVPDASVQFVELPNGSAILRSGTQRRGTEDVLVIWFIEGDGSPIKVGFRSVPTGAKPPATWTYIGTTQVSIGGYEIVQHQFLDLINNDITQE